MTAMSNFRNGSLVFRVWRDGDADLLAKFQYWEHADLFARSFMKEDAERGADASTVFYLAVCDSECRVQAYDPAKATGQ